MMRGDFKVRKKQVIVVCRCFLFNQGRFYGIRIFVPSSQLESFHKASFSSTLSSVYTQRCSHVSSSKLLITAENHASSPGQKISILTPTASWPFAARRARSSLVSRATWIIRLVMHFFIAPLLLEEEFFMQTEHLPHSPFGGREMRASMLSSSFCFIVKVNFGLTFSHGGSIKLSFS